MNHSLPQDKRGRLYIHQKDRTNLSTYIPNEKASKFKEQKPIELKEKTDKSKNYRQRFPHLYLQLAKQGDEK